MRIGTLAQHGNVGRGRINDHNIWLHHDFTDTNNVTLASSGGHESGSNKIISCSDSSPNEHLATVFSLTKTPFYGTTDGQNNKNYALSIDTSTGSGSSEMQWTNTSNTDLNMRDFTVTYVFDYHKPGHQTPALIYNNVNWPDPGGANGDTLLFLKGATGESGIIQHFSLEIEIETLFISAFVRNIRAVCKTNSGDNKILSNFSTDSSYLDVDNTLLVAGTGGDKNYNFNWITVVGKSDGSAEMYMRGKKVATLDAGQFPDEKLKGGATSITFSSALNGINKDAATIKCYEYVIFNKALNTQELYDIDWYVANKYNYNKGRAYGGIRDG